MRSLMRAAMVVAAVVMAVPSATLLAQDTASRKTVSGSWTVVALKEVPFNVRAAQKRAFPKGKVKKVELNGVGAAATYRFTMNGKFKEALFSADGKLIDTSKK